MLRTTIDTQEQDEMLRMSNMKSSEANKPSIHYLKKLPGPYNKRAIV